MHYWNKQNFEGLSKLSEELDANPNLTALASYCRFREKGLRREALSALEDFLLAARSFDSAVARSAVVTILEANARTSGTHQFLTQPLVTRFLVPTLRSRMDDDPAASTPIRWLGILSRDDQLLDRALSMCPEDTPVRKMLIGAELSCAEYATHHLDETIFLGSVDGVVTALARARDLIANAPEPEALAHLTSEVHYFDAMVADWITYSKDPTGSFPEWCTKHGRKYGYPIKIYYKR
ncbi:hypothetical protein IVA95_21675 [Bradyrhizobium sp. 157]|nr:hypothetical protein [Bradyrhizobium sp. 157]